MAYGSSKQESWVSALACIIEQGGDSLLNAPNLMNIFFFSLTTTKDQTN